MKTFRITIATMVVLAWNSFASAGLINHWAFDGTGDDTGSNNMDVTLLNGATYAGGQFGQALSLDGVNDYANRASSAPFTNDGIFTISAWAYQMDPSPVGQRYIGWGGPGARAFLGPFTTGSGQITLGVGSVTGNFSAAAAIPQQNTWQHWMLVRTSTDASLYLNGSLVQSLALATSGAINASGELHIGRQFGTATEYFHGLLDDVAIWDEALTQDQIDNVFALGAALYDFVPPPVPEPSSLLLLGLGTCFLSMKRRRTSQQAALQLA